MELSCKSEYALLALIELAAHHAKGEPLQIRQIASQQNIPDRYLEQLLATLRRGGLVRSQRGAKGGYLLAREPWKITLLEALECIEGTNGQKAPASDRPHTVESEIVRDIWQEVRDRAQAVLQKYTLQDLKEQRDARHQVNIMYYI
ncbi:Rrf2 family transcriptional regulator [Leptolyngbya valderiana BDU 20041]|uniref:RrF2 family transcriptional regulator n=1 Tax=Baaleninema simplex TaxID=2862350 RepID=UPI000349FF7A|nr:Rrf2 family transcriptional regulator [Leptolyngbya valderiana BDU 20041]PPT09770.1 putative transcriptional regulator of cysteine synthase Rrf2 family [Geitlerinema sp. FC II]